MSRTITGNFATRRAAELVVERLVQEHGIERSDIFIHAPGEANSAGTRAAGADVESGQPGIEKRGQPALHGAVEVSVDCLDQQAATVEAAFRDAEVSLLRSR